MPKRATVKRHETVEIQGEGSYVVVTGIKVRDIRKLREKVKDPDLDQFNESLLLVAGHIIEWNWVDDDEEPLPVPAKNPEVMDELTNEEAVFLTELMIGSVAAKN